MRAHEAVDALSTIVAAKVGPRPEAPRTLCAKGCGQPVTFTGGMSDAAAPSEYSPGNAMTYEGLIHTGIWEGGKLVQPGATTCDPHAFQRLQEATRGMSYQEAQPLYEAEPFAEMSEDSRRLWVEWYRACDERSRAYSSLMHRLKDGLLRAERAALLAYKDSFSGEWSGKEAFRWRSSDDASRARAEYVERMKAEVLA